MRLKELIDLAERHGACTTELNRARRYTSLAQLECDEHAPWQARWVIMHCLHELPPTTRRRVIQVVCRSPKLASWVRVDRASNMSPDERRKLEKAACLQEDWAGYMLSEVRPRAMHPTTRKD